MDRDTEAGIVEATQDFMSGGISVGTLLDRVAPTLWETGEGRGMAAEPSEQRDMVVVAPRRVLPRRVVAITLPEPYDDFTVTAWMNAPKELWREVNSGDEARILPALMQLVTAHDLVDFEGNPYPPASERAFWDEINNDLGAYIIQAVAGQIGKLDPPKARG